MMARLPLALLALAATLTACGGAGPLDRVEGLDPATRAGLVAFDARVGADRLPAMLPPHARQTVDLRPHAIRQSGLLRYLPMLAPELGDAFDDFETRTGIAPLAAFDRLIFWSDAPDVGEMDAPGREGGLLVATRPEVLTALIEHLSEEATREPATQDLVDPGPGEHTPPADGEDDFTVRLIVAVFAPLDADRLDALTRLAATDEDLVQIMPVGGRAHLATMRGHDAAGRWSMYWYFWPGGLLFEREVDDALGDPRVALERLRRLQYRAEQAATAPASNPPADRVLAARFVGETPMEIDLDVGARVGLRLSAPVAAFDLEMPPAVLVTSWPQMREVVGAGLAQALGPAGLPVGYGALLRQLFSASELAIDGVTLTFRTAVPRVDFERLLPTL